MRALLQRVSSAAVSSNGRRLGEVGHGLLVLLGVAPGDDHATAVQLAAKVAKLRVFADDEGKMNLSIGDVSGAVLAVSQFTLYGDARRGNRPSYTGAARPEQAEPIFDAFVTALRASGLSVATGRFGADMQVELVNDGPVTLWLDSDEL
ncbi:MAG: D-aminoacyl-tRNA deacylase [Trueperaceae bacterium]